MKDLTLEVLLRAIVSQHTTCGLANGYEIAKAAYKLGQNTPKIDQSRDPIGHGVIVTSGGQLDVEKLLDRIAQVEQGLRRTIDDGR